MPDLHSWLTPFSATRSYQTNLMVYAVGNYSFREFAIIGTPFQVCCCANVWQCA